MAMTGTINKFHIDKEKALFQIVLFSLISILLSILASMVMCSGYAELKTLSLSKYEYCATSTLPFGKDDYYRFNAGISFTLSPEADESLNTDVLMQIDSSIYTPLVYWTPSNLSSFGVAISKGLAMIYDLEIGDRLYSRHTVSGEICEYTIEHIVPEVKVVCRKAQDVLYDGIVIMGNDNLYVEKISHTVVLFSEAPVESLNVTSLSNILYRSDEIRNAFRGIALYTVVFLLLSAFNVSTLVIFLSKAAAQNMKRLIALGFSVQRLDISYTILIFGLGCASVIVSTVISALITFVMGLLGMSLVPILEVVSVELIVLPTGIGLTKRRLWRN